MIGLAPSAAAGTRGVCFTNATRFGVRGLRALRAGADEPAIRRAVEFLLAHQLPDCGWARAGRAARGASTSLARQSQPVMTAWAARARAVGHARGNAAIAGGVPFLLDRQLPDGDWPQRSMTGGG